VSKKRYIKYIILFIYLMSKNSSLKASAYGNKSKRIIEFYDESKDINPR